MPKYPPRNPLALPRPAGLIGPLLGAAAAPLPPPLHPHLVALHRRLREKFRGKLAYAYFTAVKGIDRMNRAGDRVFIFQPGQAPPTFGFWDTADDVPDYVTPEEDDAIYYLMMLGYDVVRYYPDDRR